MKKFSIEIKWALIFTMATILWMIFEKSMGWHDELISKHAIYTNIFAVVAIAVFVLAIKEKKKFYYNGIMNWTQGFLSGVVLSIFVAILSPLAQYIVFKYISVNFFKNVIAYTVEKEIYTETAAEAYFNMSNYIVQGAIGSISMGVITSAIVALIVQTKQPKS